MAAFGMGKIELANWTCRIMTSRELFRDLENKLWLIDLTRRSGNRPNDGGLRVQKRPSIGIAGKAMRVARVAESLVP